MLCKLCTADAIGSCLGAISCGLCSSGLLLATSCWFWCWRLGLCCCSLLLRWTSSTPPKQVGSDCVNSILQVRSILVSGHNQLRSVQQWSATGHKLLVLVAVAVAVLLFAIAALDFQYSFQASPQ